MILPQALCDSLTTLNMGWVDVRFVKSGHFPFSWDTSRIARATSMGAAQPRTRLSLKGRPAWEEAQLLYKTRER